MSYGTRCLKSRLKHTQRSHGESNELAKDVDGTGGVVNLYKNQGNLHIHVSGKKETQINREKIYTNSDGCRDIHFGK